MVTIVIANAAMGSGGSADGTDECYPPGSARPGRDAGASGELPVPPSDRLTEAARTRTGWCRTNRGRAGEGAPWRDETGTESSGSQFGRRAFLDGSMLAGNHAVHSACAIEVVVLRDEVALLRPQIDRPPLQPVDRVVFSGPARLLPSLRRGRFFV